MNNRWRPVFMLFTAMLLWGCTTNDKFASDGIDLTITPQGVVAESAVLKNELILWGGVIISSVNLQDVTQFEILAYPLTSEQKPNTGQAPVGRFLAIQEGYMELTDYAPGRLMTVRGTLHEKRSGRIGKSDYIYPLVNINQLYLWRKQEQVKEPQFHFGLGVMF
ncbi:Slp family lipoprotein [Psychromonas sp.]|uniref:Slp family lipoprotein n=1 Tax=Psychromonas sp. TaxID=1884585 RepID=UPI0039E2C8F5